MKYINITFFMMLLFLVSCRTDINDIKIDIDEEPPIVLIESSLRGIVVDEAGAPVPNASVEIGNEKISSDADGAFNLRKINVKKAGDVVSAKASGYFEGLTHTNFTPDGSSYVEIVMLSQGDAEVFQSSDGLVLSKTNGLKVTIAADAIKLPDGSSYNGAVHVYSKWIDPTSEDLGSNMPGALIATDSDGRLSALESFGMVALALESDLGATLELDESKETLIEMPIPADLLEDAPAEIDLWIFDIEEGQWVNQGTCQKVSTYYECVIYSTGYWNCDILLPAICLSGQVFNSDGTPSAFLKVIVEDLSNNFIYWGHLDSEGYFCGSVPQGVPLNVTIVDLCDNVVYSADIGPYDEDTELAAIYLDIVVEEYFIKIIGDAFHCQTNDILQGHLAIRYPGTLKIVPFTNDISYPLALKCVSFPLIEMTVYSNSQRFSTETVLHDTYLDLNFGSMPTCAALTDYFDLTVNSVAYWTAPTQFYYKDNSSTDWLVLEGLSAGGSFKIELTDYNGVGTYNTDVLFETSNTTFGIEYPTVSSTGPDLSVSVTIDDGTFISGTITGTAIDDMGAVIPIDGIFNVRKAP